MIDVQLGRRNLTPIQKISLAEKYRPIHEKRARENQSKAGGDKKSVNYQKSLTPNSAQVVENRNPTTTEILAEIAGVGKETYRQAKRILDSNNEELKKEVLSGEKSINAGYKEFTLRKKK